MAIKKILITIGFIVFSVVCVFVFFQKFYNSDFVQPSAPSLPGIETIVTSDDTTTFSERFEACRQDPVKDFLEDRNVYQRAGQIAGLKVIANRSSNECSRFLTKSEDLTLCQDLFNTFKHFFVKSDRSECGQISDKDLASFCRLDFGKKDNAICASMSSVFNRSYCQAINSGSVDECLKAPAEYIGRCEDNYLLAKALNENNYSGCEKIKPYDISGLYNRIFCSIILSREPQKDWTDFYGDNVCVNKYAKGVAWETSDISFCDRITQKDKENLQMYNECRQQFEIAQ